MVRCLISGVLMLLLLWGLGGCWALNRAEHRLHAAVKDQLVLSGPGYEGITVKVSGQHAILGGTVLDSAQRERVVKLVQEFRFLEGWGNSLRPIRSIVSSVTVAGANVTNMDTIPTWTAEAGVATGDDEPPPGTGRPAWLLICASKGKIRLAGRVSSVEESAELANVTRRFWKAAALTNLIQVDPETGPLRDRRKTLISLPMSSLPDFEVAAVSRGDGRWTTLPLVADEFMVCQALAGAEVEVSAISMALNGWRPKPPPPVPVPAAGGDLPKMVTTPLVPKPKVITGPPPAIAPVTRPVGTPHLGWAVTARDAVLFGAVRSEAEKAELLEAAERIFNPRVVIMSAVRTDPNLTDGPSAEALLPKTIDPAKPVGIAVAGGKVTTYPITVCDSDIAVNHRGIGLLQDDVRMGLQPFRELLAQAGILPLQPGYLVLVSNGVELHLTGEVSSEQSRNALIAVAQALAPGLTSMPRITVTRRVNPDTSILKALGESQPVPQGSFITRSFTTGSAGRTDIIHSVPITTTPQGTIHHERAARELELMSRRFPKARFEVAGHTDDVGSTATSQAASLKQAQALVTYLEAATGLAPGRLTVRGVGGAEPIADNSSAAGKARNRRIDISILSYE